MKQGKVWGATTQVINTPLFEAHRLEIEPNSHCSMHVHNKKWNAFLVLSGTLYIDVEKRNYNLTDTTKLKAGEMTTVAPGEYHCFRTGATPCEAYEFYYLDPLSADIDRKSIGGRNK